MVEPSPVSRQRCRNFETSIRVLRLQLEAFCVLSRGLSVNNSFSCHSIKVLHQYPRRKVHNARSEACLVKEDWFRSAQHFVMQPKSTEACHISCYSGLVDPPKHAVFSPKRRKLQQSSQRCSRICTGAARLDTFSMKVGLLLAS